jgi:hypothetical protein
MELFLGEAVDPLDLLFLAQLNAVIGCFASAALPMLTRWIRAPVKSTFIGIAPISFEKKLNVLTSTNPTIGTLVAGQNVLPVIR